MWTSYYFLCARLCHFSQGFARLAFSDTGEYLLVYNVFLDSDSAAYSQPNFKQKLYKAMQGYRWPHDASCRLVNIYQYFLYICWWPPTPLLPYSPTDSFFISNQRQTSALEQLEMNLMLQNNTSLPYHQTLPAYLISRQFIKSMGHLLDWSSVVKDESVVYNAIIKPDASLSVQADYLVNATRSIHTVTIHTIITEYQCPH